MRLGGVQMQTNFALRPDLVTLPIPALSGSAAVPSTLDAEPCLGRMTGRICLTNNCAERALRGIALGRRNWTFAGSQRGADRAAIMLTIITTCRLNKVDPKA
ncbi:hypothetical protein ACVIGA_005984 [Bradyrhizobium sp. USDA 3240]